MQSFYPSPPRRRWPLLLLAGLVLLLHGLALQGLRLDLPMPDKTSRSWQVQLPPSAAAPSTRPSTKPAAKTISQAPQSPQATTEAAGNQTGLRALNQAEAASEMDPNFTKPADQTDVSQATAMPVPVPEPVPAPPIPAAEPSTPSAPPSPAAAQNTLQYQWPASAKLVFDFVGESKGIRYSADGDMLWKHDSQQYQLRQEIRHLLLGSRSQTSIGQLTEQGLQPTRFGDKFKQEVAAHFERSKGVVSFSANTPSQPLQDGAQDRLSLFLQLAALMEGNPVMREVGQQIPLQVVSARSAEVWVFAVNKRETLQLPIGSLPTLKLSRLPVQQYDQTIDIWLSPSLGYLPVRVRVVQSNGDLLEQFLRKVQTP